MDRFAIPGDTSEETIADELAISIINGGDCRSASRSRWIAKSGGQGEDLAILAEQIAQKQS